MKLKLSPNQEQFLAPNSVSIAQGKYYDKSWFTAIYYKGRPMGFAMIEDDEENGYYLWRFMIDQKYQEAGLGKKALDLILEYVKTRPGATCLETSCVPGEGPPNKFYEAFGFIASGEQDDGEDIIVLKFTEILVKRFKLIQVFGV